MLATALASGCGVASVHVRAGHEAAPAPPPQALDTRLLLLGDTGYPRLEAPEPVFVALAAEARLDPERTLVVFLGDNIYPDGLPPAGHPQRALGEAKLRAAAEAVRPTGARAIFVPGNHDYADTGWAGMQRQRAYLEGLGIAGLAVLPAQCCPGPDVLDVGERLRLVVLDTQWWFESGPKPMHPTSACGSDSQAEIVAALDSALATAGNRQTVVVAHHPLVTHGPHGGFFTWKQHLFPLREVHSWLWVPLPVLGSLYPLARRMGVTEQDLAHGNYEAMRRAFLSVFARRTPLVYAAGHEHTLQVLESPGARLHVVSGAGTVSRPGYVGRGSDTLLAARAAGFVRLDILRDGSAWLDVVVVREDGRIERPFAMALPG